MLDSLAAYLPGGELFESAYIPGTNLNALLAGLSGELLRTENFMFLYNSQFIPDNTTVFIEEWEAAVGIPDDCFKIDEDDTNEERRLNILVKLASLGVQTASDFENLAIILGFSGVEVLAGVGSDDESIINGEFDTDTDWTKGAGWTISGGTANHVPGAASSLSQDISAISGMLYAIKYDVLNLTTGTVTPSIGGTPGVTRSENGSYEEVIQAGTVFPLQFPIPFRTATSLFSMVADASFSGSVDNISVRGSSLAGAVPRFTIVVKFTEFDQPIFPLDFPILFGDPLLGILECLFTKLKPANCDIVFLNIAPPPPPVFLGLFAWGINNAGQLGLGDLVTQSSPVQVGADEDWSAIASGGTGFSFGIKIDGTLFSWGFNSIGQLGLGDTVNRLSPVQVGLDEDWLDVSSGSSHTIALKIEHKLFSWGKNSQGQLGLGDLVTRSSPVQVGTDEDWLAIAAGVNHSLILKTDNTLFAFGFNNNGQLGLGDLVIRSSPVQVGVDEDWAVITAGDNQSLAIKTDGRLFAWGFNNNGQLALGDTSPRSSPVQVGTDTDWATVSTGNEFTLAIKTDGTLYATGLNTSGQLGLGDLSSPHTSFTQVGTDEDWLFVTAGSGFTLAIKTDGTAWAWGIGTSGQLGLNDLFSRSSPVQVGTDDDWAIVAAGVKFSLGLRNENA